MKWKKHSIYLFPVGDVFSNGISVFRFGAVTTSTAPQSWFNLDNLDKNSGFMLKNGNEYSSTTQDFCCNNTCANLSPALVLLAIHKSCHLKHNSPPAACQTTTSSLNKPHFKIKPASFVVFHAQWCGNSTRDGSIAIFSDSCLIDPIRYWRRSEK